MTCYRSLLSENCTADDVIEEVENADWVTNHKDMVDHYGCMLTYQDLSSTISYTPADGGTIVTKRTSYVMLIQFNLQPDPQTIGSMVGSR